MHSGYRSCDLDRLALKEKPKPSTPYPCPDPRPEDPRKQKGGHLRSTRGVGTPSGPSGERRAELGLIRTGCPGPRSVTGRRPHLLAEVPDAADLEGAAGLHVLALEEDGGAGHLGQRPALQQRTDPVEGLALCPLHGDSCGDTKVAAREPGRDPDVDPPSILGLSFPICTRRMGQGAFSL